METQIKAYYQTPKGVQTVTIFGYSTKGVPSLEINGVGKLSKNIKEKLIYFSRIRKLRMPLRRFVICVDINELAELNTENLKWLEFPLLLMYWYLAGLLPIHKLNDCLCSGWIKTNGDVYQVPPPIELKPLLRQEYNPVEIKSLKLISGDFRGNSEFCLIKASSLLEHIPNLNFCHDYTERDSATPK